MNIPMKDIGYDISEMKLYEDNTMTVEIDTSDWTLEQWAAILGGVPIVRCKDCKNKHIKDNVWTCPFGLPAGCDFYCGYGERETE